MDKEKQTFTLEEAAQLLGVHKETVRRAITARDEAKRLKAAKIGRDYRISRSELADYWRAQGGGELFGED